MSAVATTTRRGPPFPWLKPAILVGGSAPFGWLLLRAARGQLGANPVAEALNQLGLLTLVFLIASLAMTPLKIVFGWSWPVRVRRLVGVMSFCYASAHFATYALVDRGLDLAGILGDIGERPFIFVGFSAWLLLVPLAVTSTDRMVRRLGFVRWKRLHRLAYLAGSLGVVHYFMRVKKDVTEPVLYGVLLAVLFGARLYEARRRKARKAARQE